MADFVQTMKDWRRMCENCDRNEKIGCVVNGSVCAGFRKMIDEIDLEVVEAKVTAWAAAHPEPEYPTWGDWFAERGDLIKLWQNIKVYSEHGAGVIGFLYTAIPADIAQKLEIKPKG